MPNEQAEEKQIEEKAEQVAVEETGTDNDLAGEIDAAVEEAINNDTKDSEDSETQEPETTEEDNDSKEEEVPEEEASESEERDDAETENEEEEKPEDDEVEPIGDDLLSRAVRAGMDLSDAKAFPNAETLTRTVGLLEQNADGKSQDDKADGEDTEKNVEDFLNKIPDLDPEQYEPEVVNAFSSMKDVIKGLSDTVNGLRTEKSNVDTAQSVNWVDSQFKGLGEDYTELIGEGGRKDLDPNSQQFQNRLKILERADIMANGYKAAGKEVPEQEELFKDAVQSVLGSQVEKQRISKQLKKRSSQHINRPGSKTKKPSKSAEEDVADEINEKYFS